MVNVFMILTPGELKYATILNYVVLYRFNNYNILFLRSRVWLTEGCETEASGNTSSYTSCSCNHNTSFAILLRVTDSPVSDQVKYLANNSVNHHLGCDHPVYDSWLHCVFRGEMVSEAKRRLPFARGFGYFYTTQNTKVHRFTFNLHDNFKYNDVRKLT